MQLRPSCGRKTVVDLLRRAWDALDSFKQAYPENWSEEDEQVLKGLIRADLKLSGVKLKGDAMKHDKTFAAIEKLKDIEIELHRLKNALELANKMLDAKKPWVGLTDEELIELSESGLHLWELWKAIEAKLKKKNT
jgi:hypothetical protein